MSKPKWVKKPLPPLKPGEVRLLSGGNPQIPKGDGDGPVQAYIAAMPGWKRAAGARLDAIITQEVPGVVKAVRWNTPMYGIDEDGFFLGYHCFDAYIKISFFRGAELSPEPPEPSKDALTRYLHMFEDRPFDATQFADWVKQAAALPSRKP